MAENTKIEWATHTLNPWRGCTKVAAGCANCYADALSKRNPSTLGIWGPNGTRVMAAPAAWQEPLKWNRHAGSIGERHRVFCASLADVFEDWDGKIVNSNGQVLIYDRGELEQNIKAMPALYDPTYSRYMTMNDLRRDLFALIDATPHLDWLLLTKRPENIERMWWAADTRELPRAKPIYRPNVWLLTSIATQADADQNIPELLKCRDLCPVLGVSAEPLLEAVNLSKWLDQLDWIIAGGESGSKARSFDIAWARSIIAQCKAAGVPCFVKQLGSRSVGYSMRELPKGISRITDPKGGDWLEWPGDLKVREFPAPVGAVQ
jgi:protein gp37